VIWRAIPIAGISGSGRIEEFGCDPRLAADKRLFPKSAFPDFDIVVAGSGGKIRSKKKTQLVRFRYWPFTRELMVRKGTTPWI